MLGQHRTERSLLKPRTDPGRPKNLYLREDQILPHLAALAILHTGDRPLPPTTKRVHAQITAPARAAGLIDQLPASGVSLIYGPATKTLRTDTNAAAVTTG